MPFPRKEKYRSVEHVLDMGEGMPVYDWFSIMSIALISQEIWGAGELQHLEPYVLLCQTHPLMRIQQKDNQ